MPCAVSSGVTVTPRGGRASKSESHYIYIVVYPTRCTVDHFFISPPTQVLLVFFWRGPGDVAHSEVGEVLSRSLLHTRGDKILYKSQKEIIFLFFCSFLFFLSIIMET